MLNTVRKESQYCPHVGMHSTREDSYVMQNDKAFVISSTNIHNTDNALMYP